jgi:hypothetical protein
MPFQPNDIVRFLGAGVPMVEESNAVLAAGTLGRVCRVTTAGTCWVQFEGGYGCRRIHESFLERANGQPPLCTASCRNGTALV